MAKPFVAWFIGLRYVASRQRSRSVTFISRIAMIGIILGVALLILVLSVMNGFDKELRERILSIMPQVTLYHSQGLTQWPLLRKQLLDNDNIVAVAPFVELQGMINRGRKTEPLLLYGVDAELEPTVSIIHRFLADDTLEQLNSTSSAIVLGYHIAKKLEVQVGDKFNLIIPRAQGQSKIPAIRRVELIHILHTKTEVDGALALMGMQAAAELSIFPDAVSGLHIKTRDLFLAPHIARDIQAQLPHGFYASDWTRTHGNIYYAIQMSKNLVSLLLLLIVAIAAFNVVSTLVMVVVDKQKDIAILKTLGLGARQTVSIFMIQGSLIGAIGTAIGVVCGIFLSLTIQDLVAAVERVFNTHFLSTDIYPVSYLPSVIYWQDVLLIVLISLVMSVLATLYPTWRASKVKPAEALRYE